MSEDRYIIKTEHGEMGLLGYTIIDAQLAKRVCICADEKDAEKICDSLNDAQYGGPDILGDDR